MKILNISNMPLWLWGEGKGIPSIFFAQREFAKKGHEVHFLCPVKGENPGYSFTSGIHVHRFDFPFNIRESVYIQTDTTIGRLRATAISNVNWLFLQIFLFIRGLNLARKVKPDIICAHSLTSVFPAYLASLFLKTKFIVRVYGVRNLYWSWQSLWLRMKESRDYLAFKVPADYFIITDDGSLGNLLAGKLGVPDNKIKYWRNGLVQDLQDEDAHAKEDICNHLHIDSTARIIASTCRLIPGYGVEKLVRALVDVFKKQPDCVCIIAGGGPERKRLEEFARKNNIASRIFFMGIVDRNMIKKILYASDIFVFLPDQYNCTNTMWEAMATGRCIVTSENDAIKEILTSEKDSMLIPSDNPDSLSGTFDKLLDNESLRNELGENARIRAQQILEPWSKRIEKESELLEKLVEENR